MRLLGASLLGIVWLLAGALWVHAAATKPALAITSGAGEGAGDARAAVFEVSFDFLNAVQVAYPLQLVVFQGTHFVRYPASGPAVVGDSAELADGVLTDAEVAAFMSEGSPAPAGVRIVTIAPDHLRVALPGSFAAGATVGELFATLSEGNAFSNPVGFTLP
ncbi:MAG TPA: hypothetical protein VLI07_13175 [Candidatus Binatus sp.]|jgi:hypothetical protein|nr:hypothetical protein [Candidatus Binatus sp.]